MVEIKLGGLLQKPVCVAACAHTIIMKEIVPL